MTKHGNLAAEVLHETVRAPMADPVVGGSAAGRNVTHNGVLIP